MDLLLLAFQLLVSPIRDRAIRDEVVDVKETWLLNRPSAVFYDLAAIAHSYEVHGGSPRLWELSRFPSWEEARVGVDASRAYRNYADNRGQVLLHHADHFRDATSSASRIHAIWEALQDATCDNYWVTQRRQALGYLRELLGDEDFYSGRMPAFAPLSLFERYP